MAKADKSKDVEAGTRLPRAEIQEIQEKAGLRNNLGESQAPVSSRETARLKLPAFITSARMPSFRHFLISFTIFAIFAAAYATPALVHTRKHSVTSQEEIQFRKLLATISDPALHDALEKYISSKYQPAAGHNDATAGTNQIELAKRQSLNSTITTFTTSSETTTPGPTTSDDTTNVPPTSSTSDTSLPGGSPTVTTPSSTSEPTSTPSTNLPTSTTSRNTSTDSSSTDRTTRQSSTTKTAVYTTVRPDGSVSTVTTYTIVPAIETTSDIGPTKTPTLQDAAVRFDGTGFVGYALIFFVGLVAAL